MTDLAWYLLASGLTLGLLLVPFRLFMVRLTTFGWNRAYLLAIGVLSIGLPLLVAQLGWQPVETGNWSDNAQWNAPPVADLNGEAGPRLPEALPPALDISPDAPAPTLTAIPTVAAPVTSPPSSNWVMPTLWMVYLIGLGIGLWRLGQSLFQVLRWYRRGPRQYGQGIVRVFPKDLKASFSFFRGLFLAPTDVQSSDREAIETHERAHIDQWHSLDVLACEIAVRIWWFLPWFRVWRQSIKDNHEFLADRAAAAARGPVPYSKLLLARTLDPPSRLPVHFFALSKTQKRILMLHKTSSPRSSRWAYLAALPLIGFSFFLLACMPLDSTPAAAETRESADAAIDFAGESFPDDPRFHAGLEARQKALRERSTYCQKLWYRAANFRGQVVPMLTQAGLPGDFFYLMMAESGFDPEAASPMGACGPWQFMPETARSYGMVVSEDRDDRKDLVASTGAAVKYLMKYQKEFGSWTSAALAYNRGPAPLRKLEAQNAVAYYDLDHERGYLYRILAMKNLVEHPEAYGVDAEIAFSLPFGKGVDWEVTSQFGPRRSPFDKSIKNHNGIDLRAASGTPVRAVADGRVEEANTHDQKGNQIVLIHADPISSHYHHLAELKVKPGETVKAGQVIGTVGSTGLSTGPHLHLEVQEANAPVDPELYIDFSR